MNKDKLNKLVQKFNKKVIKTRALYPYEKEYRSLLGKTITINKLNSFTDEIFHINMEHFKLQREQIENFPTFDFNLLTEELIIELSIEQELTPDDNILMFDVIDYEPSDYHLTLDIELLRNGKIKIVNVSINS